MTECIAESPLGTQLDAVRDLIHQHDFTAALPLVEQISTTYISADEQLLLKELRFEEIECEVFAHYWEHNYRVAMEKVKKELKIPRLKNAEGFLEDARRAYHQCFKFGSDGKKMDKEIRKCAELIKKLRAADCKQESIESKPKGTAKKAEKVSSLPLKIDPTSPTPQDKTQKKALIPIDGPKLDGAPLQEINPNIPKEKELAAFREYLAASVGAVGSENEGKESFADTVSDQFLEAGFHEGHFDQVQFGTAAPLMKSLVGAFGKVFYREYCSTTHLNVISIVFLKVVAAPGQFTFRFGRRTKGVRFIEYTETNRPILPNQQDALIRWEILPSFTRFQQWWKIISADPKPASTNYKLRKELKALLQGLFEGTTPKILCNPMRLEKEGKTFEIDFHGVMLFHQEPRGFKQTRIKGKNKQSGKEESNTVLGIPRGHQFYHTSADLPRFFDYQEMKYATFLKQKAPVIDRVAKPTADKQFYAVQFRLAVLLSFGFAIAGILGLFGGLKIIVNLLIILTLMGSAWLGAAQVLHRTRSDRIGCFPSGWHLHQLTPENKGNILGALGSAEAERNFAVEFEVKIPKKNGKGKTTIKPKKRRRSPTTCTVIERPPKITPSSPLQIADGDTSMALYETDIISPVVRPSIAAEASTLPAEPAEVTAFKMKQLKKFMEF